MAASLRFERPRLKADRRANVVNGDTVFFTAEGGHFVVHGRAAATVLPFLDGTRSVAEVAEAVAAKLPLGEVLSTIGKFGAFGHLVEGPAGDDRAAAAWWDRLGIGDHAARTRLAEKTVIVCGVGQLGQASAAAVAALVPHSRTSALASFPDEVAGSADIAGDLTVVVTDDYLDPALADCNRALLRSSTPWLMARVTSSQVWLGPLFVPGDTGCWACLAQRLTANRQVERYVQTATGGGWSNPGVPIMLPATLQVAVGLVAAEALRIVAGSTSPMVAGTLVTIDLTTLASDRHTLVRQPQCPACGDPRRFQKPEPVVLTSQPKTYGDDGGHRVKDPVETVERLEKHLSPLIGAISGLHRLTRPGDEVSHAYAAGHNFAILSTSTQLLRRSLRGLSGGKGRTDVQARASAMCEAIERYTGVWRGDEARVKASLRTLGDEAVNPEALLGFSAAQYENRISWNHQQRSGLHMVPERFDTTQEIDWTEVWSLTHDRPRYVPTAYCYFGHPDLAGDAFCYCDANGNAAGNNLEEAILQGLLELVERDSVAIWWYNRSRVPALDLPSLDDGYVQTLERYYEGMGRSLCVLDITSDLGIPSFAAVSHRKDHPVEDILLGFGAHLEPKLGAMRALTECNQFLPTVVNRDSDGQTIYEFDDMEARNWWREATLASEPYVVPRPDTPRSDVRTMPDLSADDLADEIRTCVDCLAAAGIEVLVLDQSRPDLDIKVAKVMAPGLRHFWRRLGPGRLFDVPVALGRLEVPPAEGDLNPRSVFF